MAGAGLGSPVMVDAWVRRRGREWGSCGRCVCRRVVRRRSHIACWMRGAWWSRWLLCICTSWRPPASIDHCWAYHGPARESGHRVAACQPRQAGLCADGSTIGLPGALPDQAAAERAGGFLLLRAHVDRTSRRCDAPQKAIQLGAGAELFMSGWSASTPLASLARLQLITANSADNGTRRWNPLPARRLSECRARVATPLLPRVPR